MVRAMLIGSFIVAISSIADIRFIHQLREQGSQQQDKAASVNISPSRLDFGDQVTKSTSKPQRITITNPGEKDLYINSVAISEGDKEEFSIVTDKCSGVTVSSKKSCILDISFSPAVIGGRKATMVVTDNAVDSPQKVELTGNGINSVRVRPRQKVE